MGFLWDYDERELKKTAAGRRFILQRKINYGPGKERIRLADVRKNWKRLDLWPSRRRLFELLLWGKYRSSPQSKKNFFWG